MFSMIGSLLSREAGFFFFFSNPVFHLLLWRSFVYFMSMVSPFSRLYIIYFFHFFKVGFNFKKSAKDCILILIL